MAKKQYTTERRSADTGEQPPDDGVEVLGWSPVDDFNIVQYSRRDHAWINATTLEEVQVKFWWELPSKSDRK